MIVRMGIANQVLIELDPMDRYSPAEHAKAAAKLQADLVRTVQRVRGVDVEIHGGPTIRRIGQCFTN
ncbi:MAG: hypothetical protein ABFD89_03695 [Bryobacteraceae bacterium]